MTEQTNKTLRFGNRYAEIVIEIVDGAPICRSVTRRDTAFAWQNSGRQIPMIHVPGFDFAASSCAETRFQDDRAGRSALADCLRLTFSRPAQTVEMTLRTYADNPFFTLSVSLDGVFGAAKEVGGTAQESGIETGVRRAKKADPDTAFACPISEKHLKLRTVTLRDVTDGTNILCEEKNTTVYTTRPAEVSGQIFLVDAYAAGEAMLLVKEAPCTAGRVVDSAYDLRVEPSGCVRVAGLGWDFTAGERCTPEMQLYGASFGVGDADTLLRAWRDYYRLDTASVTRALRAMSNTWGDRKQDTAVCESFMLGEIERAAMLGVHDVQIDDGWQSGITANSRLARSGAWGSGYYDADANFWVPNRKKFPRGLGVIRDAAEAAGLRLGLWFSPDLANGYENWERDAEMLLRLHRECGAQFFKLDGINLTDKTTEARLAAMLERVHRESGGAVSFNFDITAQKRWGYLFRRELGSLFVENRYTDWGNYYPHSTLRTVWMLSRYIPPARLQMEFLNVRRNAHRYEGDPFAPGLYGMDWVFAAVMFASPLCWMEMTSLSEADAESLAGIMAVWRPLASELATADVTPLGEEPDGLAFTGLRADCGTHGYMVLFREAGAESEYRFSVPEVAGKHLTVLYASHASVEIAADGDGVRFSSGEKRSFAVVRYA